MTIHWKVVEQYFTEVLFVNPLTPRVKPLVIQRFTTFDSMERIHSLVSCFIYFAAVLFVFQFYPECNFGKFDNFGFGIIRSEIVEREE